MPITEITARTMDASFRLAAEGLALDVISACRPLPFYCDLTLCQTWNLCELALRESPISLFLSLVFFLFPPDPGSTPAFALEHGGIHSFNLLASVILPFKELGAAGSFSVLPLNA